MIQNIDVIILNWIQQVLRTGFMDKFFTVITRLGDGGLIWITLGVFLLAFPTYRSLGFQLILALALGYIIGNLGIKNIVARPRPFESNPMIQLLITAPRDFSFPSGHTLSSFSAAFTIFMYNKQWGVVALIVASFIAFSRIYLYVHYPTDILAAILLAILVAFMAKYIVCYICEQN